MSTSITGIYGFSNNTPNNSMVSPNFEKQQEKVLNHPQPNEPKKNTFNQQPFGDTFSKSPLTMIGLKYGENVWETGKQFVDSHFDKSENMLKKYFDLDSNYVISKLKRIFFPWKIQNWKRATTGNKNEKFSPRNDINSPDLYIPLMSFVTYIIIISLFYGIRSRFTPELFSRLTISGLVTTGFEILIYKFLLYLLNSNIHIPLLDFLAYSGYKFVAIILPTIVGIFFSAKLYLIILFITSISLGYFMIQTFRSIVDEYQVKIRNKNYILLGIFLLQILSFFFMGLTNI
ncbi:yip1 interacting factor [Anaeramoeba flamelloides]|uniref:Protein YIF1 n=1 Tax=Anaeramoeba flamelloides TaxID=1746091 RepID=A0ABQ8YI74_9EUKA|nr:yip1 interacting factor [Anaeramoeba flamelloides]